MRELDLLVNYLQRLRQEKLQMAHARALEDHNDLTHIRICAHQAELCARMLAAVKVLANDPGKFIKEFLP